MAGPGRAGAPHEQWGSKFGFLMAAIGSSVGLGNFWRFPYTAGENGGAVFILFYIACIVLVAWPVLVAEYAIGRRGQQSAAPSIAKVARETGAPPAWGVIGLIGMLGAFLILSFYSMIAGWVIAYVAPTFQNAFAGETAEEISTHFGELVANKPLVVAYHSAFMLATTVIVARGIKKGIELASEVLMPAFFLFLVLIVGYGLFQGDFAGAAAYLFSPDWSVLQTAGAVDFGKVFTVAQAALGQAFFSVGVGVALMVTYGSYLNREQNITNSSSIVAGSDTAVALIAGLAIFPIVFAVGQSPGGGPGLFFQTLPVVFAAIPFGWLLGGLFFLLALFAALTSAISLMEVSVAWLAEKIGRFPAAIAVGLACWAVGLGSIYSDAFFGFVDAATDKFLLPLGGFLIALFAGWAVRREVFADELSHAGGGVFGLWRFLIRYVATIGAGVIFFGSLYVLIAG